MLNGNAFLASVLLTMYSGVRNRFKGDVNISHGVDKSVNYLFISWYGCVCVAVVGEEI